MKNQVPEVMLRPIQAEDAETLMELNNNTAVSEFVVGNPQKVTLEQQLRWMENLSNEKNTVRFMVEFENKAVGTIIVSSIDHANATGNMNIKLLPEYHGRGIAKIALQKACQIAFDELNIVCLTAHILSYNERSCALFKRVGFRIDGILRSRVIKNGARHDLIALSLLAQERNSQ